MGETMVAVYSLETTAGRYEAKKAGCRPWLALRYAGTKAYRWHAIVVPFQNPVVHVRKYLHGVQQVSVLCNTSALSKTAQAMPQGLIQTYPIPSVP
jgi:hypothetical protein